MITASLPLPDQYSVTVIATVTAFLHYDTHTVLIENTTEKRMKEKIDIEENT